MKLENQVCSLELARKLEKLGVKQNSYWYWSFYALKGETNLPTWKLVTAVTDKRGKHSAFTVAELGEKLPMELPEDNEYFFETYRLSLKWVVQYNSQNKKKKVFGQVAKTEANARAKCLIYLKEKKLLERKK